MIKRILRYLLPKQVRLFFWSIIPKVHVVNTYILKNPELITNLPPIDKKFQIKQVTWADEMELKKAFHFQGPDAYRSKVPARLRSGDWTGLAIFDNCNGRIAYIAWIIIRSIRYFEEFGVHLKPRQFLLKDGFCVPEYRHQGLHTRMEQERINYCVRNNADTIFIQILNSNKKGIDSVINNGYVLYNQRKIIQWSLFGVYRELWSFLRSPFRKIVK
ncbi:MAG TPA: hypothetical protein PL003_05355 [Bacteroidales bacterium]|nr:hypothetical protein [Bacteroidales bacterium]